MQNKLLNQAPPERGSRFLTAESVTEGHP